MPSEFEPLKDYIAAYLDDKAKPDNPIFRYLNLIRGTPAWDAWRAYSVTDDQVHDIMRIAHAHKLEKFLNGWSDGPRPGALKRYNKIINKKGDVP